MIFKDSVSICHHLDIRFVDENQLGSCVFIEHHCAANLHQAGSVLRELRVQDLSASDIVPPELFFKDSRSAQILEQFEL